MAWVWIWVRMLFCVYVIDWRPVQCVSRLSPIVHMISSRYDTLIHILMTLTVNQYPISFSLSEYCFPAAWLSLSDSFMPSQVGPHDSLLVAFNGEWNSFYCNAQRGSWGNATPIVWNHISAKRPSGEPLTWRRQGHDYVLCRVDLARGHSSMHTKGLTYNDICRYQSNCQCTFLKVIPIVILYKTIWD